jgi:hypothetical protein
MLFAVGKFAPDFLQPTLPAVIFCLGCIAGVRLSPIQLIGAVDGVDLFLQERDSLIPRGFGVHRQIPGFISSIILQEH